MKSKACNYFHSSGRFQSHVDENGLVHIKHGNRQIIFKGKEVRLLLELVSLINYEYSEMLQTLAYENLHKDSFCKL